MIKYDNVDDFVRNVNQLAHLLTLTPRQVVKPSGVELQVTARLETPRFYHVREPVSSEYPMVMGQLGPFKVCIDPNCRHAKMSPSREFLRVQHAELCYELTEWMREFFGYAYPIYVYEDRAVMHPEAFLELQRRLY